MTDKMHKSTDELAAERTDLAVERTLMAADRSLMAWVRTGLSLISFGFTIYKFLEYEREQVSAVCNSAPAISGPKILGLTMIILGVISLLLGSLENIMTIKNLRLRYSFNRSRYSLIISGIIMILGLILFFGILLNIKHIS